MPVTAQRTKAPGRNTRKSPSRYFDLGFARHRRGAIETVQHVHSPITRAPARRPWRHRRCIQHKWFARWHETHSHCDPLGIKAARFVVMFWCLPRGRPVPAIPMRLTVALLTAGIVRGSALGPRVAQAAEPVEIPDGDTTLKGVLYRPEGPGPFPAVVALHGCDGLVERDRARSRGASRIGATGSRLRVSRCCSPTASRRAA